MRAGGRAFAIGEYSGEDDDDPNVATRDATGVHHHRGLRRHGGGAPLMGGVGYAWWPGTCTAAWW